MLPIISLYRLIEYTPPLWMISKRYGKCYTTNKPINSLTLLTNDLCHIPYTLGKLTLDGLVLPLVFEKLTTLQFLVNLKVVRCDASNTTFPVTQIPTLTRLELDCRNTQRFESLIQSSKLKILVIPAYPENINIKSKVKVYLTDPGADLKKCHVLNQPYLYDPIHIYTSIHNWNLHTTPHTQSALLKYLPCNASIKYDSSITSIMNLNGFTIRDSWRNPFILHPLQHTQLSIVSFKAVRKQTLTLNCLSLSLTLDQKITKKDHLMYPPLFLRLPSIQQLIIQLASIPNFQQFSTLTSLELTNCIGKVYCPTSLQLLSITQCDLQQIEIGVYLRKLELISVTSKSIQFEQRTKQPQLQQIVINEATLGSIFKYPQLLHCLTLLDIQNSNFNNILPMNTQYAHVSGNMDFSLITSLGNLHLKITEADDLIIGRIKKFECYGRISGICKIDANEVIISDEADAIELGDNVKIFKAHDCCVESIIFGKNIKTIEMKSVVDNSTGDLFDIHSTNINTLDSLQTLNLSKVIANKAIINTWKIQNVCLKKIVSHIMRNIIDGDTIEAILNWNEKTQKIALKLGMNLTSFKSKLKGILSKIYEV
ncbi:Leucine-rich repeat containing protein [Entamoeba marina]